MILIAFGVPEIVFLSMAGVGAVTLTTIVWVRGSRRKAASEQLDEFKEQVVSYSDAMDQLRERHKMLPFTDEDFTAPMVGETLAAYQEVEESLNRHRDNWLQLMDIWERAQQLLEKKEAAEVQKLVAAADVPAATAQLKQDCEAELDRLEQAHERVELTLQAGRESVAGIEAMLEQLRGLELSTGVYERELVEVAGRTEEGERLMVADPLSAELELGQATESLAMLAEQTSAVLKQRMRADDVVARHREAVDLVARRRAEGLRMSESQGDPDPLLIEAEGFHRSALSVLQQADFEGATRHLDSAASLIDDATEAVEFQARFRAEGAAQIGALQDQVRQLAVDVGVAQRQREQLEQRHAEAAWRRVDYNAEQADELAEALSRLLSEALAEADRDRQNYYRARELMAEAEHQLPEAQQLVAAVGQRLQELDEIAAANERRLSGLDSERQRLDNLLRSSQADRSRSNHRFEQAEVALERALDDARQRRIDWPQIERQLEHIEKDFRAVEEMVQEDLRLAQQAEAEIREAAAEVRRCNGFYQMGISASVGRAEGEVRSAERALEMQEYEQAIQLANSAEQLAREALQSAQREAEEREREAQSRRNRDAAMQMASVLATTVTQAAIHMAGSRSRPRSRRRR